MTVGRLRALLICLAFLVPRWAATPAAADPPAWVPVTPPQINLDPNAGCNRCYYGTTTIDADPSNPTTLYLDGGGNFGLFKTTDGGQTWAQIGDPSRMAGATRIAVDPSNGQHLYATVFGDAFFISQDGGATWAVPAGFASTVANGLANDTYGLAVDPANFSHVLVTFHSPWSRYGNDAGVLESTDAGASWRVISPVSGWGAGHNVFFLDSPGTWLLETQGDGFWRTANSGASWAKVTSDTMMHGAGDVYRARTGVLYSGGSNTLLRSADDGQTWQEIGPRTQDGYYGVWGDGTTLWAQRANTGLDTTGATPFLTSPETDGLSWTAYNAQGFCASYGCDGAYRMAYDPVRATWYASLWNLGVWKFQLGAAPPTATATSSPTATSTPTASATPTSTATATATGKPTDTPTATATSAPTDTPTPGPTATPTSAPTATNTAAPTATATATPTPAPTATSTATPTATVGATRTLGNPVVGPNLDDGDRQYLNGSRFVTDSHGGTVVSMSVYVGPVGSAPNNQYALGIYADRGGAPGALVAHSSAGTLAPNAWNTLPVAATLTPNTAYWLVYNANGASATLNNMHYSSGSNGAYTGSSVPFGTWPATFGNAMTEGGPYSLVATLQ